LARAEGTVFVLFEIGPVTTFRAVQTPSAASAMQNQSRANALGSKAVCQPR
jgi:hypothetical protein